MMAKDKAFRLVKEISALELHYLPSPDNIWGILSDSPGWEDLGGNVFLATEEIDLHGVTRQDLTLFFASNYTQRPNPYLTDMAVDAVLGGLEVRDWMIVSDVPLKDIRALPITSNNAGFNISPDDYMTIKLAEGVVFSQTSNAPISMVMTDSFSFASGDPSASNKLYLYRWIHLRVDSGQVPQPGAQAIIPQKRYVGTGISTEEPELVWMMRLKRSFEIQETQVHD